MLVFVVVIFAVIGLVHLYLWKRLVRDTLPPGRARRAGTIAVVVLALLVPATLIGVRGGVAEWLAWPGYLWIALMFYLLVILVVLEIPRLIIRLVWRTKRTETAAAASSSPAARRSSRGSPPPA